MKHSNIFYILAIAFSLTVTCSCFAEQVRYNLDTKSDGKTDTANGPHKVIEVYVGSVATIVLDNQVHIDVKDSQVDAALISAATTAMSNGSNCWYYKFKEKNKVKGLTFKKE